MGLRRQRSPRYRQNGLFVEPHKAIILLQPRLSSKPSLETVSLKLTNCAPVWGRIFSTTSAVAALTSSVTSSGVIGGGNALCLSHTLTYSFPAFSFRRIATYTLSMAPNRSPAHDPYVLFSTKIVGPALYSPRIREELFSDTGLLRRF